MVELLFEPGRCPAETFHDLSGPADIFEPAFHRPIRGRAERNGAHVAGLVGKLDDLGVVGFFAGSFDLSLLTFFFRQRFVVGDLAHYFGHSLTELALDEFKRNLLIFHRVVQQRCDDQVRILTMRRLGHEARHFQQVIDVWLLG